MKTIKIPEFFHEVFGESQTVADLLAIITFAVVGSGMVLWQTSAEWRGFALWQQVLLVLLYLDITGGVLANLSRGTNAHYSQSPKRRLIFIAVHVQPLLLALVYGNHLGVCAAVWGLTIGSALVVNGLAGHPFQRMTGGLLMFGGLLAILLFAVVPLSVKILLMLFLIKVVYSFGVDHDATN